MKDTKTGALHFSHKAAPGATEYNGHPIHVKGHAHKLEKLLKKAHAGHDHSH